MHGKPVEQFWVCGPVALDAKFLGCFHEALAEKTLPLPVDRDARGERVFSVDQPLGQCESVGFSLRQGWEKGGSTSGNFIPLLIVLAAVRDVGFSRVSHVGHDHGSGAGGVKFLLLGAERGDFDM